MGHNESGPLTGVILAGWRQAPRSRALGARRLAREVQMFKSSASSLWCILFGVFIIGMVVLAVGPPEHPKKIGLKNLHRIDVHVPDAFSKMHWEAFVAVSYRIEECGITFTEMAGPRHTFSGVTFKVTEEAWVPIPEAKWRE